MANSDDTQRVIPPGVMARHYNDKANMIEGLSITRLADLIRLEEEVGRCHALIKKMQAELQAAQETIAQRDEEIAKLDASRAPQPPVEE